MINSKSTLDKCGCCSGIEWLTPALINNDHGLASLPYRIGTHGLFKESMLRSLSQKATLKELTTRENDDATIALFDVWALILDILTFYNERIINEGYLLTSTERLSLVELAKHISYIPKPGVAAGSWFSFLTEESPGAPTEVNVPLGTRAQSIPGQDEKAQIFETIEDIQIQKKWNAIKPKLNENQILTTDTTQLYLEGTNTQLQQGDYLLIVDNERETDASSDKWELRKVKSLTINNEDDFTLVTWQNGLNTSNLLVQSANNAKVYALRRRAAIFGYNAPDYLSLSSDVQTSFTADYDSTLSTPDWKKIKVIDAGSNTIFLDNVYPKILSNSWMVLKQPGDKALVNAVSVQAASKKEFTLANKANKIEFEGDDLADFGFRETLVLAQSEELQLAKASILCIIDGGSIKLKRDYPELVKGQLLVVSGELAPEEIVSPDQDVMVSELVEINEFDHSTHEVTFVDPLQHKYIRSSVTINANIAQATHGETKVEILGSGNAAIPFQKFYLKQKPLTHISSASESGIATSLEIRVDDIKWEEVPTFYQRTSEERIFISRTEDDGTTYVQFGNGITGTRLPSGQENIMATYRVGIGMDGLVKSDQLSMLLDPQLGVKSVTNPLPTAGAEDPESFENIKQNAPLTVLTLDRIVSVEDFENFTSAFAGIGKARADLLWKGEDRTLHLTVAAADQGPIDETLEDNLINAINGARHENYPVVINSFIEILFNVKSKIKIHPDYLNDVVIAAVKSALIESYNFKTRTFAQNATPSEVIAIIQSVEGIIAVDLDELGGTDPFTVEHYRLVSNIAWWNGDDIEPAELLLIDEDNIEISIMD